VRVTRSPAMVGRGYRPTFLAQALRVSRQALYRSLDRTPPLGVTGGNPSATTSRAAAEPERPVRGAGPAVASSGVVHQAQK
jgi:hypothetical protein